MSMVGGVGIIAGSLAKELFGLDGFIAFTVAIGSMFILAGIIYLSLSLIPDQK